MALKQWERLDDLQYKGLKIIQDTRGFCFGLDAVLLANFASVKKGSTVLDLCTGTGIIPILLAGKTKAAHIHAIEIQTDMAEMAMRSVAMNGLSEKISIVNDDLKNSLKHFGAGVFDHITCNPPYMPVGSGAINPHDAKAIARHEILCTLNDIIEVSAKCLKPNGTFALVHRPERMVDIFCQMRHNGIEPKKMQLIHPSSGKSANLMLVEGMRCGKAGIKLLEPFCVYNEKGEYTAHIKAIYRAESG